MTLFPRAMTGNGFKMSHKTLSKVQMAQTFNKLNSPEWVAEYLRWLADSQRSLGLSSLLARTNHSIYLSRVLLLSRGNLSLPPSPSLDKLVHLFFNNSFRWLKSSIFLDLPGRHILNWGLHTQLRAVCFMSKQGTKMNARDWVPGDTKSIYRSVALVQFIKIKHPSHYCRIHSSLRWFLLTLPTCCL